MKELLTNPLFCLPLTLGLYLGAGLLYRRCRIPLFHPLLVTMGGLIALVLWLDVDFKAYKEASALLDFMLGPSVVALGFLLYSERRHLRSRLISITVSLIVGAAVGIASAGGLIYAFGGSRELAVTLQPKSVTTPIAMSLSEGSGGIPSLTAVIVVIAGLLGGIISPFIFRILRIDSRVAKGLALGASSHGMGTLTAIELGALEGAFAGLAIGLMGFFTSLLVPLFDRLVWV